MIEAILSEKIPAALITNFEKMGPWGVSRIK